MAVTVSRASTTKGQRCILVYSDDHHLESKSCSLCVAVKPVREFHVDPSTANGYKAACRACCRARDKKRYDANPDHYRDKSRRCRYRFVPGEFESMYEAQAGKCRVCDKEKRLVVDHDHASGVVRGLLCQACNTALGKFGEDVDILTSAIAYLLTTKGDDISQ